MVLANGGQVKLLNAVIGFFITVNLFATAYILDQLHENQAMAHELDLRVAKIEANRFTQADRADLLQHMMQIEKNIAALPKEVPPQWVHDFIRDNRNRIKALESKRK